MFGSFNGSFKFGRRKKIASVSAFGLLDISGSTNVAWTDDTYFDNWTSQSGVTTSDATLSGSNDTNYQLYYAHQSVQIVKDGTNKIGWNTWSTQTASTRNWWYAISSSDSLTSFGSTATALTVSTSLTSSPGAFRESAISTSTLTIPANRYFIIGCYANWFRTIKDLAAPRTAYLNGNPVVTVINQIYYGPNTGIANGGVPTALGGAKTNTTLRTGKVFVESIKFKLV